MTASPTQRAPLRFTPADGKCSRVGCGGRIEPATDGNGGSINECTKCGAQYRIVRSPSSPATAVSRNGGDDPDERPVPVRSTAGSACTVSGCPGHLDGAGRCRCCDTRNAYIERHLPKRVCGICAGELPREEGRGANTRKYCVVCKPIAARVKAAQSKQEQESRAAHGA